MLRTLEIVASSHVPCDVIDRGIWSWLKGLKFLFGFELEVFVDVNRPNRVSCQRIRLAERLQSGKRKTYLMQAAVRQHSIVHFGPA